MTERTYEGSELDLFRLAKNWKKYYASLISPYLKGSVLEVGAGMGENISYFEKCSFSNWKSLEPDGDLCEKIKIRIKDKSRHSVQQGILSDLNPSEKYDAILYLDVLEHIEDDQKELNSAAEHLNSDGHIIILRLRI